jgi:hypothetical protein
MAGSLMLLLNGLWNNVATHGWLFDVVAEWAMEQWIECK